MWLFDILFEYGVNYEETVNEKDSVKYTLSIVKKIFNQKNKKHTVLPIGKVSKHSVFSLCQGVDDKYSLMWVDMLMAIPLISEEKALILQ